jgi:uncharacterized protein YhbP (UPF0306 family)
MYIKIEDLYLLNMFLLMIFNKMALLHSQEYYDKKATEIIESAKYMTTSTCSLECEPWGPPTAFWMNCEDNNHLFFMVSHKDSKHVLHIAENPKVAVSIFDSSVPYGKGKGIQFNGIAKILTDNGDIDNAIEWFRIQRIGTVNRDVNKFFKERWAKSGRVVVQIAIKDKVFINEFDGSVDYRIPVTLSNKIILREHIVAKL